MAVPSNFFLLINLIPHSENFVLKRFSKEHTQFQHLVQDGHNKTLWFPNPKILPNTSEHGRIVRNPNLKVNLIDKKLSEEMLSFKQNMYGRDAAPSSSKLTHTLTPTTSESTEEDDAEDNAYDTDDLDFRHLLPEKSRENTLTTKILTKVKGNQEIKNLEEKHEHHFKDKVLDLRSLSHQFRLPDIEMYRGYSEQSCNCSRQSTKPETDNIFSQNHNGLSGTTLTYTLMPLYLPYNPNIQFLPSFFMDYTAPVFDEKYDDDLDSDSEEEYYHYTHNPKTTKKKKKHKCRVNPENVINIEYDLKPIPERGKDNNEGRENKTNQMLDDVLKGLSMSYKQSCPCSMFIEHDHSSHLLPDKILLLLLFLLVYLNYMV